MTSQAPVHFRAACDADRPQWLRLRHELWPHCPADRHALEIPQLLQSDGVVAVAEIGDELVGFAEVSLRHDHVEGTRSSPVPYLEGWFVLPDHRQHGIGRGLLDFVEQWAVARGFDELASDAEIDNLSGIRLHASNGFAEVGRTVHFVKPLGARPPSPPHPCPRECGAEAGRLITEASLSPPSFPR